ncbi:AbrB family transcriptional regulator [Pararhodobacter sp. CCB-MM2]|uniref:AbrB family transcriptional regulator n=1 Tax=Pararhodobacter sp. CCB-MM2 TaxID=1786003 RepID=UPI0008297EF3|nr:AbrB family transcriptional regulator [Pararhodobacter sp. CCB-MM2]
MTARPYPSLPDWQRIALTLGLAAAGALVFNLAGLPLPFLFGPMCACLIAALFGVPLKGTGQLGTAMRTILGVAVGATLTPALIAALPSMIGSVLLIPIYIGLIGLIGVPFFRKVAGYDAPTAWYASMPGGLQDMIIFGTEAGANMRTLSLIHATRVLIIVTIAPVLLTQFMDASLSHPVGEPARDLPWSEMALMVAAALIGWKGGEKIGLFGASILGPLIVTGALSLSGLIHHRPPAEAIYIAQFFIGAAIGVGYTGITLRELRRDVLAGVGFVLILAVLAAIMAEIVYQLGLAHPMEAFLAFAPGGQAEMTVLAIVAGADLGYVVVHHILRILMVITGAPIAARLMNVTRKDKA